MCRFCASAHADRKCTVQIAKLSLVAALALPGLSVGLLTASPAVAECATAADLTMCSESAVLPMPMYPYPCDLDWMCGDGGMSLMFDPSLDVGQKGSGGLNAGRSGGPDRGGLYTDPYN
jgi:hypothetical protein